MLARQGRLAKRHRAPTERNEREKKVCVCVVTERVNDWSAFGSDMAHELGSSARVLIVAQHRSVTIYDGVMV